MISLDALMANRQDPAAFAETVEAEDIAFLVSLLGEKNNDIRYAAFLALQKRSEFHGDVYPYWDILAGKLKSENSYQRSIGIMLLAENIRWDGEGKLEKLLTAYLSHCQDEKFITSRQTIQSLLRWLPEKPFLFPAVVEALTAISIAALPLTQQKLILTDILEVLISMQAIVPNEQAAAYIFRALGGGILDKKARIPSGGGWSKKKMQWYEQYGESHAPSMEDAEAYVQIPLFARLQTALQDSWQASPKMEYSRCSMQKGWNIKYKKSGRSLCTLYPMEGFFIALVVIGQKEATQAEHLLPALTPYIQELYHRTPFSMGGRWLMMEVREEAILADVLKLIALRMEK